MAGVLECEERSKMFARAMLFRTSIFFFPFFSGQPCLRRLAKDRKLRERLPPSPRMLARWFNFVLE